MSEENIHRFADWRAYREAVALVLAQDAANATGTRPRLIKGLYGPLRRAFETMRKQRRTQEQMETLRSAIYAVAA